MSAHYGMGHGGHYGIVFYLVRQFKYGLLIAGVIFLLFNPLTYVFGTALLVYGFGCTSCAQWIEGAPKQTAPAKPVADKPYEDPPMIRDLKALQQRVEQADRERAQNYERGTAILGKTIKALPQLQAKPTPRNGTKWINSRLNTWI